MERLRGLRVYPGRVEFSDSPPQNAERYLMFYLTPSLEAEMIPLVQAQSEDVVHSLIMGGHMIIFDYAPSRLRVVGTYHAMNPEDMQVLEHLVEESDFVAVECDKERLERTEIVKRWFRRGYVPEEKALYVSPLDFYYIDRILQAIERHQTTSIMVSNQSLISAGGEQRDSSQSELGFCMEVAKRHGKDLYLVDSVVRMFQRYIDLGMLDKLHHMWYMRDLLVWPRKARKILETDRETDMLSAIEEEEGPIEDLERQGTLVVGSAHAVNYMFRLLTKICAERGRPLERPGNI